MTYAQRAIDVTIKLGEGQFGDDGADTVTLTGLRVMLTVVHAGGAVQGEMQVRVFGLPQSMINRLTAIGPFSTTQMRNNTILVAAGDLGGKMTMIYQGTIHDAVGNYQAMPEVSLDIHAYAATPLAMKPVGASSWKGAISVDTIMKKFASDGGLTYQNSEGIKTVLNNPYFPGTLLTQIQLCAKAADIFYKIEKGTLTIWPKDKPISTENVIEIANDGTMIGYPIFSEGGMIVNCEFLPTATNGGTFKVKSDLPMANKTWKIASIEHHLESEKPGGMWTTTLKGVTPT